MKRIAMIMILSASVAAWAQQQSTGSQPQSHSQSMMKPGAAIDMAAHQQEMRQIVSDLVDTFEAFQETRTSGDTRLQQQAIDKQEALMRRLRMMVQTHSRAMQEMMKACQEMKKMQGHQSDMKALLFDLTTSFDAVLQARDTSDQVQLQPAIDQYAAHLNHLRESVREHDAKSQQAMKACQMKGKMGSPTTDEHSGHR